MVLILLTYAATLVPLLGFGLNYLFSSKPNLRDVSTLIVACITFSLVMLITFYNGSNSTELPALFTVMEGLDIRFHLEPLGLVFALIASGLWILTHIYGVGYMRANAEKNQTRFFAFFCLAISATLGIAFSANLFSLFIFYEMLTLSTFPLVAHKGTGDAIRGSRVYLGILISTSVVFFLSGIIWVFTTVGTLDFRLGGIIHSYFGDFSTILLLMLFAFGVGKAALFPFHSWLPSAMVAPTPVSALLHAVAVVKAGVFSILKIGVYIFGIDHLASTEASNWLIWLAAFTILFASTIAISKDNLKARLAYSTVSQLSYIVLGLALATAIGALGAALHIVMHAFGKITLFMTAGSIYVTTKKTEISDMVGLGRIMPLTFFAFFVGSLSIIGIPLLGGAWSKWYLLEGAVDADLLLIIIVLLISSLMNVYYLLSIVGRGFFLNIKGVEVKSKVVIKEAPILCLIPPILTAAGSVLLFFFAGRIINYLNPVFNFTGA